MQVILLEKVANLGQMGDLVKVRPGYARNFLLPQGKAKQATENNIAEFQARRAELEKKAAEKLAAAQARKAALEGVELTIAMPAGTEGKLFGSVGTTDIAAAAEKAGVDIAKSEIRMPEGALRHIGEYDVAVHLHTDVDTVIKVIVTAEA